MPQTWKHALAAYRYPVTRSFAHASKHPLWRPHNILIGDVEQTTAFEDYFRSNGSLAVEPWGEVVFWKLGSQGGRADIRAHEVLERFSKAEMSPAKLWNACEAYTNEPSEQVFDEFRLLFGFKTKVIAIVATFPAFMAPDRFAMVDARIAKWVGKYFNLHNSADPSGPQLVPRADTSGLSMRDFQFMHAWIAWCSYTAQKLQVRTGNQWRARDVEMAVFQAWGDSIELNPLPLLP